MNADPFQIFPRSSDKELDNLRASVEAVGLRNPVVVDEAGNVIDGHGRRDICNDLKIDWLVGADVRIGLSQHEKLALAIDLNMWRRPIQLSRTKRSELIDIYLIANPQLSDIQIADLFGVSQPTVNRRRRSLIQMNKLAKSESTVGRDGVERKVGVRKKKPARTVVKNRREFEKLVPDLAEVGESLSGLIRHPKRIHTTAHRQRKEREVEEVVKLPTNTELRCCDFRDMNVESGSADLVLTDVVWSPDASNDWLALAQLASRWLSPEGLFVTIIGQRSMFKFVDLVKDSLKSLAVIAMVLPETRRNWATQQLEQWRPALVMSRMDRPFDSIGCSDVISVPPFTKDYHDWQQSLDVAVELVSKLSRPGGLIVDPQVGTGTNAVAATKVGEGRRFIGCDIDEQQIARARHRMATECDSQLSPHVGS